MKTIGLKNGKNCEAKCNGIAVYVCSHKAFDRGLTNSIHRKLCVGGYHEDGELDARVGVNIEPLNAKLNECTALYWVWKNTNHPYKGLCHYRRYFIDKHTGNLLDEEHAREYLKDYQAIFVVENCIPKTIVEHTKSYTTPYCDESFDILRESVKKYQPSYLKAFDDMMSGHYSYLYNMVLTRGEIFDAYCEWLFSFIIPAAEEYKHDDRGMGYWAEMMQRIWFTKNFDRRKDFAFMPCITIR